MPTVAYYILSCLAYVSTIIFQLATSCFSEYEGLLCNITLKRDTDANQNDKTNTFMFDNLNSKIR